MADDWSRFKRGAVSFPLTSSTVNSLLQDADPAIFYALDYLSFVLTEEIGARLVAAAQLAGAPINQAVAYKTPMDPEPFLQSEQFAFPLLAVYRKSGTLHQLTASYRDDVDLWEVAYILPPLTAGQSEAILPILHAAKIALDDRAEMGRDIAYTPPTLTAAAGDSVWGASYANLEAIKFTTATYARLPKTDSLWFHAVILEAEVKERTNKIAGSLSVFGGADFTGDVAAGDGTKVLAQILVSTQQAPTLTSLSVATGGVAGGTSVTLTGTLFLGPVTVSFGGALTANPPVVVSATSITCTTPAHTNAGAVDVVISNADGQYATMTSGFTYT